MSVDPLEALRTYGAVPVVALQTVEDAVRVSHALLEGGLPVIEITFRTAVAREAITRVRQELPEMVVAAGTVTDSEQLSYAHEAGAHFAVSPGLNPELVRHAQDLGVFYFPGVFTPTEVERALALGCRVLKFFPAGIGASTIASTLAPYRHLGVEIIPTGGIDAASAPAYWDTPGVVAVAGSWIAPASLISTGDWGGIRERAASATSSYRRVREHMTG